MQAEAAQQQRSSRPTHSVRVLHVVASAGRYGAEAVIAALSREQHALGLHVHVAIISDNLTVTASYAEELKQQCHAEVTVVEGRGLRDLFLTKRIAEIATQAGATIIHSHGYKSDILCSRVELPNVRRISTLHGWTTVKPWSRMALYQSLQVRALRRFDAVVAVHESVWRQHHGLRAVSNQMCIANGIPELDCASPSDGQFAWLPESHPPLVLVVGRISQEKGQLLAIEALMELRRRGVDVLLVCAGDGPQMPILRASVKSNELSSRVLLPGYIQKIAALLKHATVLLIPSSTEGMPMILLEAMRSGVPVVASAVGGMASVLGYGRVGRLVSPGSSMQIADAISDLLDCPTERETMKREGQLRFADHYSSRVMAHHYQQAYEKLLVFSMAQPAAIVAAGAK